MIIDFPLRCLSLIVWATTLAWFSLAPDVKAPPGPLGWDKFNHFIAYAVLALLMTYALAARRTLTVRLLFVSWAACFAYGLLLESLQWVMAAGRRFELADLAANGLGALTGCVACVIFRLAMKPSSRT